jgi:hypothetical protein
MGSVQKPWWVDPAGLFSNNHWKLFFPDPDGPLSNANNAIVRFSIYGGVILFLATQKMAYLAAIPFVMLATYALSRVAPNGEHMTSLRDTFHHITCTKPTAGNPFMNVMPHEIASNPERDPACTLSKKDVAAKADAFLFNSGFGADLGEEMNYRFLQRQFVSQPNTNVTPGDTGALANWCFQGTTFSKGAFEKPAEPIGAHL